MPEDRMVQCYLPVLISQPVQCFFLPRMTLSLPYLAQILQLLLLSRTSHQRALSSELCISTLGSASMDICFLLVSCSSISVPSCTTCFNLNHGLVVKVMASSCFAYILPVLMTHTCNSIPIHFTVKFSVGFFLVVFKKTS